MRLFVDLRPAVDERSAAAAATGTSVVTAADDESNAVVVVHSSSFAQYSSGVVIDEWDLVLNNRPRRGFDSTGAGRLLSVAIRPSS